METLVKHFIFVAVLALSGSLPSQAHDFSPEWENVVTADAGKLAIDRIPGSQGGFRYQMVLRGDLVRYLVQDLAVVTSDMLNDAGEIIFDLGQGYRNVVSRSATYVAVGGKKIGLELTGADYRSDGCKLDVTLYPAPGGSASQLLGTYNFMGCEYR